MDYQRKTPTRHTWITLRSCLKFIYPKSSDSIRTRESREIWKILISCWIPFSRLLEGRPQEELRTQINIWGHWYRVSDSSLVNNNNKKSKFFFQFYLEFYDNWFALTAILQANWKWIQYSNSNIMKILLKDCEGSFKLVSVNPSGDFFTF